MAAHDNHPTRELVMQVMEELITQQQAKVLACAARIDPRLTADDLLQPHDFPALGRDPAFNYEDGVLAGLRSAEAALRAALARAAAAIGAALCFVWTLGPPTV